MSNDQPNDPTGGIAELLRHVVADAMVKARVATIPLEAKHRRATTEAMMDDWEGKIGEFAAKWWEGYRTLDPMPEAIADALGRMTAPTNQIDFILNVLVAILGVIPVTQEGGSIVWAQVLQNLAHDHQDARLSPPTLAIGTVKGVVSQEYAEQEAAYQAVNKERMDLLIEITGDSLGVQEALELYRRGIMNQEDLDQVLQYSNVNPKFYKWIPQLAHVPMSGADAINAYIKGEVDHATAQQYFTIAGGDSSQFDVLAATAGNPIGVEQALNLWNHGFIDETEVDKVIAHSRINPIFEADAKYLRFKFLSPYQIVSALKAGDATPAQAKAWLISQGYAADQVAAVVSGAGTPGAVKAKTLTESLILDTYEAGLISQANAISELGVIGYSAMAAGVILEAYDAKKILSATQSVIGQVRKEFIAGRINNSTASNDLDALGVDAAVRDGYLRTWAIEATVELRQLTMAQIGGMAKKGIISYDYAESRWSAMGYSDADVTLLSAEYGNPAITLPVA